MALSQLDSGPSNSHAGTVDVDLNHLEKDLANLVSKLRVYQPNANTDLIRRAFVFAAEMHTGQMRKSGEPYITHPLSVAKVITEMKLDAASVCAAILHDVVEDTRASEEDIKRLFGDEIAFLVDGVTKLGKINFTNKEDQQAESFRKMLVAMARDIRVLLVKLADRVDNMRTLEHMKPEAQERIANETLEIFAPLSGRLGINWIKSELEDLSFQYLYPEVFSELARKTKTSQKIRDRYIQDVCKRIQTLLAEHRYDVDVSGRVKHLYSIHRKMKQQNCEFEQVYDYIAFRIQAKSLSDCYAILGAVHAQWTPIPGRFKDYIALPKPNMYQSLHTTVIGPGQQRIEIQIRTEEMHRIAEDGIAAHWQYKELGGGVDPKDAKRFAWLKQLMEFQQEQSDPAEFIDSVKMDLFNEEVYVFTPQGDLRVFAKGATCLDFAYGVHSEVGDKCVGAKINGSIAQLRQQVKNGDVIEILTRNNQRPSKDWLDFVVTSKARGRIRSYIRTEERKRSVQLGKELLERFFRKKDISFSKFVRNHEPNKIAKDKFRLQGGEDEMYALVGIGKISPQDIYELALGPEHKGQDSKHLAYRPNFFERAVSKVSRNKKEIIVIESADDVLVELARCCNPLPGDTVTGWMSKGQGIIVHRRGCKKSMELDLSRKVEVAWSDKAQILRQIQLHVTTTDKPGILSNISRAFTESNMNISEANCRVGKDGTAINVFTFTANNAGKINALIKKIRDIDGVRDVTRQ